MFETLRNAWKLPELRKKLMFTAMVLLLYRIGNVIPVPYVNVDALKSMFDTVLGDTILGLYNAMSGSAFSQATVLALSIQPYINASIIIQLLTVAIPALERMAKEEGEEGKKKINVITRCTTVGLGLIMGWAFYSMLNSYGIITKTGFLPGLVIVLAFTAGSAVVMWLGEQINEFGIGNGISMILFANIISGLPAGLNTLLHMGWWAILVTVVMVALVLFIIFVNDAERRIPIQYAKRVVGRKQYGGQSTHLPMKVNMSGVMPVIFASTICGVPATIAGFAQPEQGSFWWNMTNEWFRPGAVAYIIIYVLLIFAFAYFYSTIQFNPIEVANNMKKNGGFIPGFRPGKPTSDFIKKVLNKITMMGAIFLAIIAALPLILSNIPSLGALAIGGTTTLIMVSVSLETVRAIEGELMMRHYKGFLE